MMTYKFRLMTLANNRLKTNYDYLRKQINVRTFFNKCIISFSFPEKLGYKKQVKVSMVGKKISQAYKGRVIKNVY